MSEPEIEWDVPVGMHKRYDPYTRTHTMTLDGKAYGEAWEITAEWDEAWGDTPPIQVTEDLYRRLCSYILRQLAHPAPEVPK